VGSKCTILYLPCQINKSFFYLSQQNAGSFVMDGYDAIREYFNNQQLLVEKYFRQRRLDKLQQKLRSLTKGHHCSVHWTLIVLIY
jgi:hypothetical protein